MHPSEVANYLSRTNGGSIYQLWKTLSATLRTITTFAGLQGYISSFKSEVVEIKNIESFFLNTLLRICMFGVLLILVSNILLFPEDKLSILVSSMILSACILSYLIRVNYPTLAVLIFTSIALVATVYQRLTLPSTTTSLSIVLVVGFIVSVMLKGRIMWTMHSIALVILNTIFILSIADAVTAAITYSTLYFILAFAAWALKSNYDKMNQHLSNVNIELLEKSSEIAKQNEELLQIQNNLNELNINLEKTVNERTVRVHAQNEILMKYSYANAHHLRGPVARLLGLVAVCKLEPNPDMNFFIDKIRDQANEIDEVIKKINADLDTTKVGSLSQKV